MNARFGFVLALVAASLVACGGGGGGGGPIPTAAPSATPPLAPPSVPVTFLSAPSSAAIPSGAGVTGTISLPSGSGSAVITASTTPPTAIPAIQVARRDASVPSNALNNGLVYVTVTAQGAVTMNGLPGFSVTLPARSPSGTYFVGYYDTSGQSPAWVSTTLTGAAPAGTTLTLPATTSPTLNLASGASIYLVVYVGGYIPPININGCVGVQTRAYTGAAATSQLIGVHPVTSGDAYSYSGTLAQAISRAQPCPQPTATANAAVSISVTTSATTENSNETDTYPTHTTVLSTTANITSSGGTDYETSETAGDANNNSTTTVYSGNGLAYAQQNEGPSTWTNAPPSTVTQHIADGTVLARQYASGGSYTETDTIPGAPNNTITVNADASGSYVVGAGTQSPTTFSFAAPAGGSIVIHLGSQSLTVPSWLPAPLTLYSDTTHDMGSASSLPCAFTYASGTPEHIVRTLRIVDPVIGYIETETTDSYDLSNYNGGAGPVALGPVCSTITDTLASYYDYTLSTPYLWYFSLNAQPVTTSTITEQLSLQNSGLVAQGVRRMTQSMRAQVRARQAGIAFMRAMQRAQTLRAIHSALGKNIGGLR